MIIKWIKKILKVFGIFLLGLIVFYSIAWSLTNDPSESSYRFNNIEPNALISEEKALEDFQKYYTVIKTAHPKPYRYISKGDFNNTKDSLVRIIQNYPNDSLRKVDLYFLLRSLAAETKDSHTNIFMPGKENLNYFPYKIIIMKKNIYIVGSDSTTVQLPVGSEITSLNGIAASNILDTLSNFVNTALEHTKNNEIAEDFSFYLNYYFNISDSVSLKIKSQAKDTSVTVKLMQHEPDFHEKNQTKFKYQFYQLSLKDKSIPVIDLNSFSDINIEKFKKDVDLFFEKHHNEDFIIIDVRNNGGGSEVYGRYILGFLTDKRLKTYENYIWKMSETARWQILQKKKENFYNMKIPSVLWNLPIHKLHKYGNYIEDKLKMRNGEIRNSGASYFNPQDSSHQFKGHAIMLVNHQTASAAQDIAAIFKKNELGTIIGRETKNNLSFGGNIWTDLELQNSGIRYYMPMTYGEMNLTDTVTGVKPHIEVNYSFKEYTEKIDKEIEKAKNFIINSN